MNRVTDIHIHVQPVDQWKPDVLNVIRTAHPDHFDYLVELMEQPSLLLESLDDAGIWRAGLINYPSPDIMGFQDSTNEFVASYASYNPERLLAVGGVHPRFTNDPTGDVDRLVDMGIRCLKIHPPHQAFPANAYTEGLESLAAIYRRCEHHRLPVMVHTGTSIFPGARCKYGRPMELDDVALDFPGLTILMAHGGRPLWTAEAFFIMRRHSNVFLEISGIPPKRLLHYFPRIEEIGDRIVWGTDWPSPGVRSPGENLEQFRQLDLPESWKTKVTVDTPLALFPA